MCPSCLGWGWKFLARDGTSCGGAPPEKRFFCHGVMVMGERNREGCGPAAMGLVEVDDMMPHPVGLSETRLWTVLERRHILPRTPCARPGVRRAYGRCATVVSRESGAVVVVACVGVLGLFHAKTCFRFKGAVRCAKADLHEFCLFPQGEYQYQFVQDGTSS